MYTVVPKHPHNESERDPYPLLDLDQNWGLTDEEFNSQYGIEKESKRSRNKQLLKEIIKLYGGESELDTTE